MELFASPTSPELLLFFKSVALSSLEVYSKLGLRFLGVLFLLAAGNKALTFFYLFVTNESTSSFEPRLSIFYINNFKVHKLS